MSLRSKLEAGQAVAGAFLGLRSPDAAELMSQSGFDFLLVDAEHSNIGPDGVLEMLRAIDKGRAAPLVRLSETSASHVQWALDGGAEGILFPRIRSVEDVELAVSLCRYPPDGIRGLGPGRASGYGANMLDYAAAANSEIMVMIQVETMEAVDCIDDIAAVPGVDLIFIGPGDLSQVLGIPGEMHHPRIREIGKRALSVCRKNSVHFGILTLQEEYLAYWKEQDARFFALGTDALYLTKSCRRSLGMWDKYSG